MDLYEVKQQYYSVVEKFNELKNYLDLGYIQQEISKYEDLMSQGDFWNDQREAKKVIDSSNRLKNKLTILDELSQKIDDIEVGLDLIEDETDQGLGKEIVAMVQTLTNDVNQFEIELLLTDPYDKNNAILELHPGAGGTESQDWGEMLMRMYMRYAEQKDFKVEILDYLEGEEAGIKSVTLLIKGTNAYGYLKAERGVHRLVRISPFDSSGRRHTSFASVDVMPEVNDDIEIEILAEDLKVDTYRASGAGGQHVNKTESAIRLTHIPSGVVVSCQSDRSQIQNRDRAMKMLKSKLYQIEKQKKQSELLAIKGEQKEIGWGSQIRSYVFHPYSLVKDHRTNAEVGNVNGVMDGDIDYFINEYLRYQIKM
jgi:peptide chain release factor 2